MPTSSKQTTKRPAHPPPARAPHRGPPALPFLRFHHSEALREETLAVLASIETAPDPLPHRTALADLVAKLMDSGLDYYFLRPLRFAKVGFVVEQSAHIAAVGASRVLATVTRNILLRMDRTQLLTVCTHIRQLMQ